MPKSGLRGFTLAEVLIALLLLGVLAAFTITKVLQVQQEAHARAVLKDVISTLSAVDYQGSLEGAITSRASWQSYIISHLNTLKACPTNSSTDPDQCIVPGHNVYQGGVMNGNPGVVLKNGANVNWVSCAVDGCLAGTVAFLITVDYNGSQGPNLDNQDQLTIYFNSKGSPREWDNKQPGQFGSPSTWGTTLVSAPLFYRVFGR